MGALTALRDAEMPDDLRRWGEALACANAPVPLLGLGVRAATYPALLWNGARLERAGGGEVEALTMVGVVSGPNDMAAEHLLSAVRAGFAVAEGLSHVRRPDLPIAVPSAAAVAAAACAAIAADSARDDVAEILDLAGTLMVVGPPRGDALLERSLRAGHGLAAGWLAVRLMKTGIVGVPDGLSQTISTVSGHPIRLAADRVTPRHALRNAGDGAPSGLRLVDLLDGLS